MKKLMLLLIISTLFVSGVSAEINPCGNEQSYLGTFKQRDTINLMQTCDSCTYVNLSSITYPNSNVDFFNTAMTKQGYEFNYSFSNTSQLECYSYKVCGDKDGTLRCESISFKITPSGEEGTLWIYLVAFVIGFFLIVLGFKIEDNWPIVLGGFILILLGLYILFYGIVGLKDAVYTWALGIIVLMVGGYFSIRGAMEALN